MCNSRVFSADCTTTYSLPLSVECRQFVVNASFSLPVDHSGAHGGTALRLLFLLAVADVSLHCYAAVPAYGFLLVKARGQCNCRYFGKSVIVEPPVVKLGHSAPYVIGKPVAAALVISYLPRKCKSAVFQGKFQSVIGDHPELAFRSSDIAEYSAAVSAVDSRALLNFKIGTTGHAASPCFTYKKYHKAK